MYKYTSPNNVCTVILSSPVEDPFWENDIFRFTAYSHLLHSTTEPALISYAGKGYFLHGNLMSKEDWEKACVAIKFAAKLEDIIK